MTSCPFCDVIIRFDYDFPSNGNPVSSLEADGFQGDKQTILKCMKSFLFFLIAI